MVWVPNREGRSNNIIKLRYVDKWWLSRGEQQCHVNYIITFINKSPLSDVVSMSIQICPLLQKYSAFMAVQFNHPYPSRLRLLTLVVVIATTGNDLCALPNLPGPLPFS